MKLSIVSALLLVASAARADGPAPPSSPPAQLERCTLGIELADKGELARAALYLESCTDEDGIRTKNSVAHKLEKTQLSSLTISTLPEGLVGEIDAYPGEHFTTPATVWVKAGTYKITVDGMTVEKIVEARSRTSVIINAPPPKREPKTGVVDFGEETEQHQGPPPPQKFGSIMPKKYSRPTASTGEQIDDPFARAGSDADIRWRLGLRAGAGIYDRASSAAGIGVSLAALAARPLDGPVMLTTRVDWSHRELDTIGANVGFGIIVLQRRAFVMSAGAALRGEVRVQGQLDMMEVARAGIGAAADVDVAVMSLPLALGLRVEHGFTELIAGARNRAVLFELGYDWR